MGVMAVQSRQRAVVRAVHVPYPRVAPSLQEKELDKFLVRGHLTRLGVCYRSANCNAELSTRLPGSCCGCRLVVPATHIDPPPTKATRNLSPAGDICLVIDRTTKAERKEIAMMESMMEAVVEVVVETPRSVTATEGAAAPALNTSADHRRCSHRAPMHHHRSNSTPMHGGEARSATAKTVTTTAAPAAA